MLSMFRNTPQFLNDCVPQPSMAKIAVEGRYSRNLKDDMKKAMDLLFQFNADLAELHPDCQHIVERMLAGGNGYPR